MLTDRVDLLDTHAGYPAIGRTMKDLNPTVTFKQTLETTKPPELTLKEIYSNQKPTRKGK